MFDHSNCGIGAIANLDGTYSHNIIEQGMTLLKALSHRGGTSKDGTGDGCGILLQIPTSFYEKRYGIQGDFAVMMTFLPKGENDRQLAKDHIYETIKELKLQLIKEIVVPVDASFLTPTATQTEPVPTQFIIDMTNQVETVYINYIVLLNKSGKRKSYLIVRAIFYRARHRRLCTRGYCVLMNYHAII